MIEVKNLTKVYGDHAAVKNLNFRVEEGHIYGFLGPNGAGKSTTMNIITGCLAATDGRVFINGHDVFEEPLTAKRCIGYLPEIPPLYPDMTPTEYLRFVGRAKGLSGVELSEQINEVIAMTGLETMRNRLIGNLSKGYRQRVGIAQALIGNPEIIILDEPTVGLDPKQIIGIRRLIRRLGEKHTVILSSHILSEISEVCDYVMILSHGNLVAEDSLENLTRYLTGDRSLALRVRVPEGKLRMALNEIPAITEYTVSADPDESDVTCAVIRSPRDTDLRDTIFFKMAELRYPVVHMSQRVVTLEDVFLRLTAEADEASPDDPLTLDEDFVEEEYIEEETEEAYYDGGDEEEPIEENEARPHRGKGNGDGGYTSLFGGKEEEQ